MDLEQRTEESKSIPSFFPPEFYKELQQQKSEKATLLFQSLEKMLTTEAATPEREQIKVEFIKVYMCGW